ncbi:hypothetical protein PFISCL1PPCAC_11310, partial [Pristionchus fissidentatus]
FNTRIKAYTNATIDLYCVIPHAPSTYEPDEDCVGFNNDEQDSMCYQILMLEANSCCDHLVLYEGTYGGKVIADLTGDHNERGKKFTTTSGNFMRASWQPKGGVNVKGM